MKKILVIILTLLVGIAIGVGIMHIPAIRYDLNHNGRVDIADFLRYYKYFLEH